MARKKITRTDWASAETWAQRANLVLPHLRELTDDEGNGEFNMKEVWLGLGLSEEQYPTWLATLNKHGLAKCVQRPNTWWVDPVSYFDEDDRLVTPEPGAVPAVDPQPAEEQTLSEQDQVEEPDSDSAECVSTGDLEQTALRATAALAERVRELEAKLADRDRQLEGSSITIGSHEATIEALEGALGDLRAKLRALGTEAPADTTS